MRKIFGRALVMGSVALPVLLAATVASAACPALPAADASGGTIDAAFAAQYKLYTLRTVAGIQNANLGGMAISPADKNALLLVDNGESADSKIWSVKIVRDECNHIVDFGVATLFANVPQADASIIVGPKGSVLATEYPTNHIAQISAGDLAPTYRTALTPLGVSGSVGGLAMVPPRLAAQGEMRVLSYSTNQFFAVPFVTDAVTGQITFAAATLRATLQGGPGGITYVPSGSPGLNGTHLVVAEYGSGAASLYEVNDQGDPAPATRKTLVNGISGVWGTFYDAVSGDLFLSTWGSGRVHVVTGFAAPDCSVDADCGAGAWCTAPSLKCTPKLRNGEAIPTQANHVPALTGKCTATSNTVCASAVCDTKDDRCGFQNGQGSACTAGNAASVCRSGVCDADLQCGFANGNGSCSADAGAPDGGASTATCRSGLCGGDGKCGGITGDPCTQADQCRSSFCSAAKKCDVAPVDAGVTDASGDGSSSSSSSSSSGATSSSSSSGGATSSSSSSGGAASSSSSSGVPTVDGGNNGGSIDEAGCSCDVPGGTGNPGAVAMMFSGAALLVARLRRRRR